MQSLQPGPSVCGGQMHRPVSGSQTCPGCLQAKHSEMISNLDFINNNCLNSILRLKILMKCNFSQISLLVQPLGENPQNPARHASQFRPPTPGLQEH